MMISKQALTLCLTLTLTLTGDFDWLEKASQLLLQTDLAGEDEGDTSEGGGNKSGNKGKN
jgi:hypothetical protein